jgi:hypothetical protein
MILPDFIADTSSPEALRRQFIDGPMEGASQEALGALAELAELMAILPGAFVDSQQRELKRLLRKGDSNTSAARAAAMKLSIAQAQTLKVNANLGQVRLQKALAALADKRILFHGFVSNTAADPLAGLTVRLSGATEGERKAETALTDGDGYFSIVLGEQRGAAPTHGMAQRVATMMRAETGAAAGQGGKAQVEIVGANGQVRYTDPNPLLLDGSSVYREYVLGEPESPSPDNGPKKTPRAAKGANPAPKKQP